MPVPAREKRKRRRVRVRHAAWIRTGNDAKPLACVLWDQSEDGARIAAPHCEKLPEVFTLVRDKQSSRLCRVRWRKSSQVGVQFIDGSDGEPDGDAAPARKQAAPPPARPEPDVFAMIAATRYDQPIRAAQRDGTLASRIAGVFLIVLLAQSVLLYSTRHESDHGVAWAGNVCRQAGGLCQHPLISFAASALMAGVYLAIKGMEL